MIKRLVLSALILAALGGCETTGALDTRWYHKYQEYLAQPHYRALAVSAGTSLHLASAIGWTSSAPTVESAIEGALAGCSRGETQQSRIKECRLYAIGDIVVSGMSDDELEAAIKIYKSTAAKGPVSYSARASDYAVCSFAIIRKDGKASWASQASWLGDVNEAKRRNLTPEQCAEILELG